MTYHCEWQALHGTLCSHQCDDCKDEDAHPRTPPALTRLAERQFVRINDPRGVPAYHPTEYQPIRVGGPET